jgi:hypothetical protein
VADNGGQKQRQSNCEGSDSQGEVLSRKNNLLHLNICNNSLDIAECSIIEKGLAKNNSLFGLPVCGNSCSIDSLGFLHPFSLTPREKISGMGFSLPSHKIQSNQMFSI